MSQSIDLYYFPPSPPCRAVMLVGKMLGINFNMKVVNIMEGQHMNPEYMKLNPQHSIPTISDNGFVMWESRPIICYLVEMYGKDQSLYPKDPKQRAAVNQKLYFDMGTLYQPIAEYFFPVIAGMTQPDEEKKKKIEEALGLLELFLDNKLWVTGSYFTIADISLVVSVSTAEAVGLDIAKYPNILAWYIRVKQYLTPFDYDDINQAGADMIGKAFKSKLKT